MDEKLICRICGYTEENYFPYGKDMNSPDYDFCVCCGVEHGYKDWSKESALTYRKEWIEKGTIWESPENKPINWDYKEQLKNTELLVDFFS